jgi:hypothetical protein
LVFTARKEKGAQLIFHPLIHTLLGFDLAQDIESIKKAEPKLRMVFEK